MKMTQRMYDAITTVSVLHNGQHRKEKHEGRTVPFIVHPFCVCMILSCYTDDEDVLIAGLFHDVLEDVEGVTKGDIASQFGERVADIVVGVTHDSSIEWKASRTEYLEMLQSGSTESLLVACADKIHNITSHIEGIRTEGAQFWKHFTAEPEDYRWFYESFFSIAQERLQSAIVDELYDVVERARKEVFNV